MSQRNFILLIIVLVIVVIGIFGFLYFRDTSTAPGDPGEDTNFISQFNPFGRNGTKPQSETATPSPIDISGQESDFGGTQSKLTRISSMPIAGFGIFMKERFKDVPIITPTTPVDGETSTENTKTAEPAPPLTEFAPAVRYVERATGNIYQTFADQIIERRFSETTIPKVHEAYFGNRGESVVMRYLQVDEKTIETFVGALPKEHLGGDTAGNNEIKGSFLPNNVRDISVAPDGLKIFYLFISGDSILGTTLNLLDDRKTQVFDSPFTEWLSGWPNNNMITLSTKPSANVPGHMYAINLLSKNLTKILGGINGLTALASPDGELVLYSDNNLSLYIHNVDSRNSDILAIRTLPEKCVWASVSDIVYCAVPRSIGGGGYPDIWYQGEVSFDDQLWKIDAQNGNATLIFNPTTITGGEGIDGIKLALDEEENYLFFVNKRDSFLWKLNLR